MIPLLIDAALRSLLVALAVWAGLRALRVRNVVAQKAAWGLVLAAAAAMPWLLPATAGWQLVPAGATVVLPAAPLGMPAWLRPADRSAHAPQVAPVAASAEGRYPAPVTHAPVAATAEKQREGPSETSSSAGHRYPAPLITDTPAPAGMAIGLRPLSGPRALSPLAIAWLLYLAVVAFLIARLGYGVHAACSLWQNAKPLSVDEDLLPGRPLRLRSSEAVFSPVTIGSGILLPAEYAEWDAEKLRVVVAHEGSHVRQGDFYLQLLAGMYAAVFWFSPLGWWLKRKLSELSETISDRAGLSEAASGSSYAQILIEFAALPRPTLTGVAMARTSNLSHRIERLLNDVAFRQAFAGSRRALLAVLVVPVALFASTALIRVQAAGQAAPQAAPSPAAPAAPSEAPSPAAASDPAPAAAPSERAMPAPPAHIEAPEPPNVEISAPGAVGMAPMPPPPPTPNVSVSTAVKAKTHFFLSTDGGMAQSTSTITSDGQLTAKGKSFYSYRSSSDGDSYVIVRGNGNVNFNGDFHSADIDKARKMAQGDFLFFSRNGKSYVIDDPAVMAKIEAMYKPMEDLGRDQEKLGKLQEELGRQQEALGKKQEEATVPAPDISKEMAKLNAAMAELQAKKGSNVSQEEISEIQERLGELQGKLGELQGKMGDRQGEIGEQQGKLGEQQGKLGEEQGRLGEQQGKLAEEANRKVKGIIDESLRKGTAKPVE
jgi:beta-lactamase regulating signal transducer with metallopeptidase domain